MKTVVFSDTHLSKKFDQRQFDYLKKIIESADRVIINGDFWDDCLISFDEFLTSKWSGLFPLLKTKETIYIFGNHDRQNMSDDRIYNFCHKAVESFKLKLPKQNFFSPAPNTDPTIHGEDLNIK